MLLKSRLNLRFSFNLRTPSQERAVAFVDSLPAEDRRRVRRIRDFDDAGNCNITRHFSFTRYSYKVYSANIYFKTWNKKTSPI